MGSNPTHVRNYFLSCPRSLLSLFGKISSLTCCRWPGPPLRTAAKILHGPTPGPTPLLSPGQNPDITHSCYPVSCLYSLARLQFARAYPHIHHGLLPCPQVRVCLSADLPTHLPAFRLDNRCYPLDRLNMLTRTPASMKCLLIHVPVSASILIRQPAFPPVNIPILMVADQPASPLVWQYLRFRGNFLVKTSHYSRCLERTPKIDKNLVGSLRNFSGYYNSWWRASAILDSYNSYNFWTVWDINTKFYLFWHRFWFILLGIKLYIKLINFELYPLSWMRMKAIIFNSLRNQR